MPLDKLEIPPDQSGYAAEDFNRVLSVELDGGVSRTRLDSIGGDASISVQWTVGRSDFESLISFYQTNTNFGAEPFLLDLYSDFSEPVEHECHFIPGSLRLTSQLGSRFVLSAELEAKVTDDEDRDLAIVEFFAEYDSVEVLDETLNEFENLFEVMDSPWSPPAPEYLEPKAELVEEYCTESILDETLQSLEDLVGDFQLPEPPEQYQERMDTQELIITLGGAQEVKDLLGELEETVNFKLTHETSVNEPEPTLQEIVDNLREEYGCCSEDILDQTLQSLEDLVVNLEIPQLPYDNQEDLNAQEVIAAYGDAQVADDVLEYLDFLVNREIPNLVANQPQPEPTLQEIVDNLRKEYGCCSEDILHQTLEQLELTVINLQVDPPMSDATEGLENLIDELGDI
jgi:hypothetical protein